MGSGIDSYTKLLLHCNGTDATVFFRDSSVNSPRNTLTAEGNAHIEVDQYKFGTASLYLDGSGDYAHAPDSEDWHFGTEPFTIDFWVRFAALPSSGNYIWVYSQLASDSDRFIIGIYNDSGTYYLTVFCDSTEMVHQVLSVATDTWYHIALARSGSNWHSFLDGTLLGTDVHADAVDQISATMKIGTYNGSLGFLNAYIDEFRISKGIARWTSGFTPETSAYEADDYTVLLLHCDGSDGSTTITDSAEGYATKANGEVQIDVAEKKFGTASALFDGTDDYITVAGDSNLAFGTDAFTIDCWIYLTNAANYRAMWDSRVGAHGDTAGFSWGIDANRKVFLYCNGFQITTNNTISLSTWTHVAIVRTGNIHKIAIDGVFDANTWTNASNYTRTTPIIGTCWDLGCDWIGYIDEFRVSVGIARWTTDFSVPTEEYAEAAVAPTVTTSAATSVVYSEATLNGNIIDTGGENCTVRGFEYGKTSGSLDLDTNETGDFSTGAFSLDVSSLDHNDTYYARAYATNSAGTSYGDEVELTTLEIYNYFRSYTRRDAHILPNHVVLFYNNLDGEWTDVQVVEAEDTDSVDKYGDYYYPVLAGEITDPTEAQSRASVILARLAFELDMGTIEMPHDCRIELYDRVDVQVSL